jgi:hypothetical protein
VTAGLALMLPSALFNGLTQAGLPTAVAQQISHLPPIAALFATFLGYNPMKTLLPDKVLHALPQTSQNHMLGQTFFPNLISAPFMDGLRAVFYMAAALCLIAAVASLIREKKGRQEEMEREMRQEGEAVEEEGVTEKVK